MFEFSRDYPELVEKAVRQATTEVVREFLKEKEELVNKLLGELVRQEGRRVAQNAFDGELRGNSQESLPVVMRREAISHLVDLRKNLALKLVMMEHQLEELCKNIDDEANWRKRGVNQEEEDEADE
ncbi:hypothetical protein [Bythopirellula goksoeyrii]|nr:hypothetical protein [Bythopirellula goksoeyrii]